MCDKSRNAVKFIIDNLKRTRLQEDAIIINKDYAKCLNELKNNKIK